MEDDDVTGDLSGVYLKRQDFDHGDLIFTIVCADRVVFEARNGQPEQTKWVLTFASEPPRKFPLNKTNLGLMAKAYGRKASAWVGIRIELFLDESVSYAGRLVGGIRVRLPKRGSGQGTSPTDSSPQLASGF